MTKHSLHSVEIQRALRAIAEDVHCAACGNEKPTLRVIVHGHPVIVCDAVCRNHLQWLWKAQPVSASMIVRMCRWIKKYAHV